MNRFWVYARVRIAVEAKDEHEAEEKGKQAVLVVKGAELRKIGAYPIEAK